MHNLTHADRDLFLFKQSYTQHLTTGQLQSQIGALRLQLQHERQLHRLRLVRMTWAVALVLLSVWLASTTCWPALLGVLMFAGLLVAVWWGADHDHI
ncbi:MAG: hypothetical protein RLY58_1278 [Pseudomonadota bacterium]|jgi:hypothetical protein